jgi:hypothetical protein
MGVGCLVWADIEDVSTDIQGIDFYNQITLSFNVNLLLQQEIDFWEICFAY